MDSAYQYDTQRAINGPVVYNNFGNPVNFPLNYNINFATNDPSVLCLSGNAYTIKTKGD